MTVRTTAGVPNTLAQSLCSFQSSMPVVVASAWCTRKKQGVLCANLESHLLCHHFFVLHCKKKRTHKWWQTVFALAVGNGTFAYTRLHWWGLQSLSHNRRMVVNQQKQVHPSQHSLQTLTISIVMCAIAHMCHSIWWQLCVLLSWFKHMHEIGATSLQSWAHRFPTMKFLVRMIISFHWHRHFLSKTTIVHCH